MNKHSLADLWDYNRISNFMALASQEEEREGRIEKA